LPALHYGRDSLVAVALVLSWMARHNGGPEKFVKENPSYAMPKKKFELGSKSVAEILPLVKQEFSGWNSDERDGLWLSHEKSWVHVRASNTEPVIRVIAEASTQEEAERLCAQVEKLIRYKVSF
jgi:phosphomannomutase